ncbi:uncharacterized protein HMPREF1541_05448 [Cyphellophora europaea CBS 101466]|uniref:Uncharacterized protein n=1 Tax=Cyphellophora europaea (strain CBS 101466) TaxID=1220924 RepID=W2RSD1_CYPE1|nr:uncharacterized protein HMPREF1541_05448 [Cyphellophora europaea CBS 101466]ETN39225.1 hypothetical protein HMPREF1541_05448 [Cyphellophora europaea CBS 101466]
MSDKEESQPQEQGQEQEQEQSKGEGGSWYSKPEGYGNAAGDKVESVLSPVGKPLGKGLETAGKPIGGLVEPIVGGISKAGETFGNEMSIGFGNKEGGPAKQQEAEAAKMKEPLGGKEQTGDNPLGL